MTAKLQLSGVHSWREREFHKALRKRSRQQIKKEKFDTYSAHYCRRDTITCGWLQRRRRRNIRINGAINYVREHYIERLGFFPPQTPV